MRVINFLRRNIAFNASIVALMILIAFSLTLWITAGDQTKQSELATSLLSGAVVGVVLVVIGEGYRKFITSSQRGADLLPDSSTPDLLGSLRTDSPDLSLTDWRTRATYAERPTYAKGPRYAERPESTGGTLGIDIGKTHPTTGASPAGKYEVRYLGNDQDPSRASARRVHGSLERSGTPIQLFDVIGATSDLSREIATIGGARLDAVWWYMLDAAKPTLVKDLKSRAIPADEQVEIVLGNFDPIFRKMHRQRDVNANVVRNGEVAFAFEI